MAGKKEGCETMNPKIVIRNETHSDVCAITEVTIAAFKTLEISNHTEQFIIEAIRAAKGLTVSLRAMSLSMKGSKRMANKRVSATLNSAPDPRRWSATRRSSSAPRH